MSLMYAQMGLAGINAISGYGTAKHNASMQRMQQDYTNSMNAFAAAQALNTQTANETSLRDAAVTAKLAMQGQSMQDMARAEVSAAAAGVAGGSVDAAMRGLTRSKLQAQMALKRKMQSHSRANAASRRGIALNKAMGKDISVIPKSSVASALLGLGAQMIDIYDSHQPEGQQTTDIMARWGRE